LLVFYPILAQTNTIVRDDQFNRYEGGQPDEVYSKRVRAGKRTYFFDVKSTRSNDYYITITESKRGYEEGVYIKHKIYLYKEDFHKFVQGLNDAVDHVKTELMPDHDFSQYEREFNGDDWSNEG
jgi:hypothetical protein